jgi:Sec-independent protein translocase protein TatA
MDLQTLQIVYYSMSIVFMTLLLIAIIALIVVGVKLLIKVNKIQKQVEDIVDEFQRNPSGKATEILMNVGSGLASAGVKKVRQIIDEKTRR